LAVFVKQNTSLSTSLAVISVPEREWPVSQAILIHMSNMNVLHRGSLYGCI
jgi:hypothetical protein